VLRHAPPKLGAHIKQVEAYDYEWVLTLAKNQHIKFQGIGNAAIIAQPIAVSRKRHWIVRSNLLEVSCRFHFFAAMRNGN
jgi:hypothetical protein